MIPWNLRPSEIASFYNPAYLGRLLREFIASYQGENPEGVTYELTFVAMPLIALKTYSASLPNSSRTPLHNWIQNNSDYKLGFASIINEFIPFVKETLIFLLQRKIIVVNEKGKLIVGPIKIKQRRPKDTDEIIFSIKKAKFVGKWFAKAGDVSTIYSLWGIRL